MTPALFFAAALTVSSPAFVPNAVIPAAYTCDGAGTSPPLSITGVPQAAKSLALIVFDPDVPKTIKADGRYLHWALWNLATTTTTIDESRGGGLSEGGRAGWVPPCPPNGEHRYVFQVFALDRSLGDEKISNEADLRRAMDSHTLEQAELVGRYTSRTSNQLNFIFAAIGVVVIAALAYRFIGG